MLRLLTPMRVRAAVGLNQIRDRPGFTSTSWRVLRDKRVRWYFAGSVTSDLGTWLQNTAQVLLAYRLAHSVLAVALVTCAQFTSPLVLGPWAGVLADRFGGRRTLLGTQVVAGLIAAMLGVFAFTNALNEGWLIVGALLSGICFTFALPARNVTIRRLVRASEVPHAFVMDAVSYNLGRTIAPLMGIAMLHWMSYGWAFAGNAISFGIFTVILWGAGRQARAEPERRSRITDGFRIARDDGRIMILLFMVAAVTVADDPILVLGPALASKMHVAASWSGWFIAALGGGSVAGSLRRSGPAPSLRLAAAALALLGGAMVLFVMTPWMWVSVAAAFTAGVSCLIANSATRTMLARVAGPHRVASVMAVWAIAWAGSKPLASLMDGLLAGWLGVQWTGVLLAIPTIIPIVILLLMPNFGRRLACFRRQRPAAAPAAALGAEGLEGDPERTAA